MGHCRTIKRAEMMHRPHHNVAFRIPDYWTAVMGTLNRVTVRKMLTLTTT